MSNAQGKLMSAALVFALGMVPFSQAHATSTTCDSNCTPNQYPVGSHPEIFTDQALDNKYREMSNPPIGEAVITVCREGTPPTHCATFEGGPGNWYRI